MSPVYTLEGSAAGAAPHLFAATICVPKKQLYPAVKELRKVCGGGEPSCSCAHPGALQSALATCHSGGPQCCTGCSQACLLHCTACPTAANPLSPPPPAGKTILLLQVGGSGVLVQPMTYIFDAEPARWRALLENLGVSAGSIDLS